VSQLFDEWKKANIQERYDFLIELDRAYGFWRLCKGVIGFEHCKLYQEIKEKLRESKKDGNL